MRAIRCASYHQVALQSSATDEALALKCVRNPPWIFFVVLVLILNPSCV